MPLRRGAVADPSAITALEAVLGGPLPPEIRRLDDDHAGMPAGAPIAVRLLTPAEAAADVATLRGLDHVSFAPEELSVFWTDDNSNDAGVYLSGPLEGRVFYLDHEDTQNVPSWCSVGTFYDAPLDNAESDDWTDPSELRTDDPRLERGAEGRADDDAVSRQLLDHYLTDPEDDLVAFQAIALSAPEDNERLLPLLQVDDMWVQEAAAQLLGARRWAPAVEPLTRLALSDSHNGRIGALVALRKIASADANAALEQLRAELPDSLQAYLPRP